MNHFRGNHNVFLYLWVIDIVAVPNNQSRNRTRGVLAKHRLRRSRQATCRGTLVDRSAGKLKLEYGTQWHKEKVFIFINRVRLQFIHALHRKRVYISFKEIDSIYKRNGRKAKRSVEIKFELSDCKAFEVIIGKYPRRRCAVTGLAAYGISLHSGMLHSDTMEADSGKDRLHQ